MQASAKATAIARKCGRMNGFSQPRLGFDSGTWANRSVGARSEA